MIMGAELERWLKDQPDYKPRHVAINEKRRAAKQKREAVAA
jgi:hypothetical protein